ncbi:MAG: hypothetical protein IT355_20640 [Gemmatimonadaceae bacterium]|nr:hypothetical protein [Gemmatimonadaceae bacterium]
MSTTEPRESSAEGLSAATLDAVCAPLAEQVRRRRIVPAEQLIDATPADYSDPYAWLTYYGQLRAWLAKPLPQNDAEASADELVTAAIREAPLPVSGLDGFAVYPKSFETMLQLKVLDAQLDRLVARLMRMIGDDATLIEIDSGIQLASAVTYVTQLIVWTWTSEGAGLPFRPTDSEPIVPERIVALTPAELLAISHAAHQFGASLAACQELIDPVPVRDGGKRASWAAFFEAVGAQTHLDPRELAVTHSITKVLSMAYLASDRLRVKPDGDDA